MELSYYHGASADPLSYSTYWSLLDRQCDEHPDREAVIFYDNEHNYYRKTFGELRDEVLMHAGNLISHFPELKNGDPIGVVGSNRPELLLIHLVALKLGLSVVFVPTLLKSGDDLAATLAISNCKGVFIEDKWPTGELLEGDKIFIVIIGQIPIGLSENNVYTWKFIFDQKEPTEEILLNVNERYKHVAPESDFATFFSSGSNGRPKGILWSQASFMNTVSLLHQKVLPYPTSNLKMLYDRPVTSVVFGLCGTTILATYGLSLVIVQTSQTVNSSDPKTLFTIIEKEAVTHMVLSGYMMHDFVQERHLIGNNLGSLKGFIVGGQLYNKELGSLLREALPDVDIFQCYGGTEMGVIAISEHDTTEGFVGKPLNHVEVKIINKANGESVKVGEPGELYCRGPNQMVGYVTENGYNNKRNQHNWYPTDDGALMNHKGEIKPLGRMTDVIKRATLLIYPATIENVIAKHPKVEDVQVVGVSDPNLYQEICACVVASDPALTEEELRQWCVAQLFTNTLTPRYYVIMEEFPRAISTKIDRKKLMSIAEKLYGKSV